MIVLIFYTILALITLVMLHALIKTLGNHGMHFKKLVAACFILVIAGLLVWLFATGRLHFVSAFFLALATWMARGWRFLLWARFLGNVKKQFKDGFSHQSHARKQASSVFGAKGTLSPRQAASILGVSIDATEQQIKKAWREKLHTAHPDKGGNAERTQSLNEAKDILIQYANQKRKT